MVIDKNKKSEGETKMDKAIQKEDKKSEQANKDEAERRRRHFREDYKKKIVADILSGKLDKNAVVDAEGNKISKYLVDRWKAEYRGHKFVVDALTQTRGGFNITTNEQPMVESPNVEDLYKELVALTIENRKLKEMISVQPRRSSNEITFTQPKAYSGRF